MKSRTVLGNWKLTFEPRVEKEFINEYYDGSLPIIRFGIILGLVLYPLFGILDEYMLPISRQIAWFIRFAIVVPFLAFVLILSFSSFFSRVYTQVVFFTSIVLAYGILFMIYFSRESEPGYNYYYSGLMLVIIWVGTFSQLRFKQAAISILFIILGYLVVSIYRQHMVKGGFDNPKFPIFINNNFFFLSSAILAFFSSFSFEAARRNNFLQRKKIEAEKKKSDQLLLNVLPASVADDLKANGTTTPMQFDNVTVFFSDSVDFTRLSADIEPEELISALNELFTAFDNIMEKNRCERIKTIGDAYLAVSGMPEADADHAWNMARAAVEIVDYCQRRNLSHPVKWEVRIGIHTGKVIGGVVGVKKYIYDVFGNAINVASRMETLSEPMRINISETSYRFLRDHYPCKEREEIPVKGVGTMKMYFLN